MWYSGARWKLSSEFNFGLYQSYLTPTLHEAHSNFIGFSKGLANQKLVTRCISNYDPCHYSLVSSSYSWRRWPPDVEGSCEYSK